MLSLEKIKQELQKVFTRFPVWVLFIIIFSAILFTLSHGDFLFITESHLARWAFSCVIWFFFSIGLYLYWESKDCSNTKKNLLQWIPVGYSLLYFWYFENNFESLEAMIFFSISMVGIIGFLFFAPYIKNIIENNGKQSIYYTYFYNISVIILTSFILGGILFTLWSIWITAVNQLFDLYGYFWNEIYIDWAITSLAIVTPIFGLTKLPCKREFTNNYFNENAFFSFLIKYIAIPFIYLYFIILYLYSAKVLINFSQWPKWEVSWMVIGFSIFWYVTYIFSYIFEEKNRFIKTFRKYFPYAVVPQVFMLFYAIYLRIAQYDITINRYFVVIFWIWLLLISLYYILSKKKYLWSLMALLTLFTLIISVGPWSVYSLPKERQLERLKNNLIEANILQWNTIVPLKDYNQIEQDLSKNIYSGIDYVCDFNDCREIKELFPDIYAKTLKNYQENNEFKYTSNDQPSKWQIIEDISETIKVRSYYWNNSFEEEANFYISNQDTIFPIDTKNIDMVYSVNSYNYDNKEIRTKLDSTTGIMTIFSWEDLITQINYQEINDTLLDLVLESKQTDLSLNDLSFNISNNSWDFIFIIDSMTIFNSHLDTQGQLNNTFSFHWYLLEK